MSVSSKITVMPAEKGTAAVTVTFTDETGAAITPVTCWWKLTDTSGTVINSRSQVTLTPAESVTFAMTGSDLAITPANVQRVLLIGYTYNSTLGSNLQAYTQAEFSIYNLVGVS